MEGKVAEKYRGWRNARSLDSLVFWVQLRQKRKTPTKRICLYKYSASSHVIGAFLSIASGAAGVSQQRGLQVHLLRETSTKMSPREDRGRDGSRLISHQVSAVFRLLRNTGEAAALVCAKRASSKGLAKLYSSSFKWESFSWLLAERSVDLLLTRDIFFFCCCFFFPEQNNIAVVLPPCAEKVINDQFGDTIKGTAAQIRPNYSTLREASAKEGASRER